MRNARLNRRDLADPVSIRYWPLFNRDRARTPMQWCSDTNAGFTTGKPWLPIVDKGDSGILSYYRSLKEEVIFVVMNFSNRPKKMAIVKENKWRVLFSTHRGEGEVLECGEVTIGAWEASVLEKAY